MKPLTYGADNGYYRTRTDVRAGTMYKDDNKDVLGFEGNEETQQQQEEPGYDE